MEKEYIERGALLNAIPKPFEKDEKISQWGAVMDCIVIATSIPAADVVEVEKVAELLRHMFNDDCACNYNGNDGWLTEKCKYAETDCPTPKEPLGCWKEFVKHSLAKMDGERKEATR